MVGFCTVCKIVAGQEDDVSIHRLPKDKETRANWLAFIGHETNANSGVCSKHFKESDFIYKIYGNDVRRFIKPGACPSVLQRPQNTNYISLRIESNFDLETGITIKEEIQESTIIDETLINTENLLDNQLKREIDPLAITEHNINLETNVMSENGIQEFISTGETLIDTNSMDNQLKRQTDDPLAITECDNLETNILSGNERQEPININEIINTNSIDAQLKRQIDDSLATRKRFCNQRYVGNLCREDFTSDESWHLFENYLIKTKTKVKSLNQTIIRLNKKVSSLQEKINHLREIRICIKDT